MRGGVAVLAGGLALVIFVGVVAAGPPLVSAGLDQDVVQGDPVYLDAGGTHVPDGELAGLEWSIEAPNGSTVDPECVDCEVTWFRANQTGQYDVTLTAESASGVERSDTMYVSVSRWSASSSSPSSNVSGSSGGGGGGSGCFIAYAGGGDNAINHDICSHTGSVVDSEVTDDGNNVVSYIVEMTGNLLLSYPGIEYAGNGRYRIPEDSINHQSENIWEAHQGDEMSIDINGGTSAAISRNSGSPSETCNPRIPSYYC